MGLKIDQLEKCHCPGGNQVPKDEKEQLAGIKIMIDRLAPFMISETVRPSQSHVHAPGIVETVSKQLLTGLMSLN